jgi:hypothetical protein
LTAFSLTALGVLLCAAAAIALIDPLAISPARVVSDDILPQTNRRYLVPAIVRGHRHDSYIVGTSSVHSLDPKRFEAVLGGSFANLSLFASTPHEQRQVLRLVARERPDARTIVWGLDFGWCRVKPPERYTDLSEFPEWLYDKSRWNDLSHALNWSNVDLARRKLMQVFRDGGDRLRADGFLNMMPPDAAYTPVRLRAHLSSMGFPPATNPMRASAPTVTGSPEAGALLPGVAILEDIVAGIPPSARLVLVLMPPHANLLPEPGSRDEQVLEDCKAAISAVARQRGAWLLDAMWRNAWTVEDNNFWDPQHFRDHVAEELIAGIGAAVTGGTADSATMRLLARGGRVSPSAAAYAPKTGARTQAP